MFGSVLFHALPIIITDVGLAQMAGVDVLVDGQIYYEFPSYDVMTTSPTSFYDGKGRFHIDFTH